MKNNCLAYSSGSFIVMIIVTVHKLSTVQYKVRGVARAQPMPGHSMGTLRL